MHQVSAKKDTYDPRVRDWFKTTVKKKRAVWTDPYLWLPEIVPGVSFTIPSFNEENEIERVLTVDIELNFINDALKSFYQYKSGAAFIVNEEGTLIAHSKLDIAGVVKKGESSLPHVKRLKDKHTRLAFESWQKSNKREELEYYYGGDKFFLRSRKLDISENVSWYVLMTVSELENLSQALDTLYRALCFSLWILLLIVVMALIINHYLTKSFGRIFEGNE